MGTNIIDGACLHVVDRVNPLSHWVIQPYLDSERSHCQFRHALFLCHSMMEHSFGSLSAGRDGCGICKCPCFEHFVNNWSLICSSLLMWRCKRSMLLWLQFLQQFSSQPTGTTCSTCNAQEELRIWNAIFSPFSKSGGNSPHDLKHLLNDC